MLKRAFSTLTIIASLLFAFSCAGPQVHDVDTALASLSAGSLAEHVKVLSSDEFEGRAPVSDGEEKTVQYLEAEFKKVGAQPGNGESYFQDVPLVEITPNPDMTLTISGGESPMSFSYGDNVVAWSPQAKEKVDVKDSELVFVGYGVVAPEFGWNDYEGVDVQGKTVVMLVNDPGFATEDPEVFNGRAMTYYGRWTYKFEEAARQGAAAALLIHETEPAAYGWGVVRNTWMGKQFSLVAEDGNAPPCDVVSWISLETTEKIFSAAGLNYQEAKASALEPDFEAVPLGLKASVAIENGVRNAISQNVVAVLPGSDRADEYIVYVAHWDHFGMDPTLEGDQIFNGALDNATGTAALVVLATAFKNLGAPTGRSIIFLAATGEEQWLLGSHYYATHPIYPLTKTAAVINMDGLCIYGRMKDVRIIGYGQSELDDYARLAAAEQDQIVLPNAKPERGSFFRSDHFPFAQQGVPALSAGSGIQHREKGEEYGRQLREQYNREKYHKPSDEYDDSWDLTGAAEDMQLYFKIGFRLAMESTFPSWKEGSEFKAKRDADMAAR
jgi:Zn-dependent M28 family amino/carboxypeptidase